MTAKSVAPTTFRELPPLPSKAPKKPEHDKEQGKHEASSAWLVNAFFVSAIHALALYACVAIAPTRAILLSLVLQYQMAMFGIGVGYHRLWSHRAFKATFPMRLVLMLWGTLGLQGSAKWWVLRHRLHHRYTDTEFDPYNAKRGFWFSHIGWIFERPEYERLKYVDKRDLEEDWCVRFQHRYFVPLAVVLNFVLPTVVGFVNGSTWREAVLWGAMVPRVIIWHVTFCINSFAHLVGDAEYSSETTAKGNLILAMLTSGEGWHSFHHAFPHDYRNGHKLYHWDPSKWFIFTMSKVGLVSGLFRVDANEVEKAKWTVKHEQVVKARDGLDWGKRELPLYTYSQIQHKCKNSSKLIVIDGKVLDVTTFRGEHPGGAKLIDGYIGKDATKAFYGIMTNHSGSAKRLIDMLAIGRVLEEEGVIKSRIQLLQ